MATDILLRVICMCYTIPLFGSLGLFRLYMRHVSTEKYRMNLPYMEELAVPSMQHTDQ